MTFARHKNSSLRAVFGLLHLALALWALTVVCSAFAQDGADTAPTDTATAAPIDQRHLDIWEFRVEGNTLLSTDRIEAAVYSFLGPQRAIGDIDAAANNLERAFRDSGYPAIYVSVPEQNVEGGVVKLQVVEGKIERVRVQGSRYFSIENIREKLPSLQSGNALHVPTMQKELSALNAQSGDMKVTPILKAGRVMLKILKITLPVTANDVSTRKQVHAACRAMRARFSRLSFAVSTRNGGIVASGSTMKNTELRVKNENSRTALSSGCISVYAQRRRQL